MAASKIDQDLLDLDLVEKGKRIFQLEKENLEREKARLEQRLMKVNDQLTLMAQEEQKLLSLQ